MRPSLRLLDVLGPRAQLGGVEHQPDPADPVVLDQEGPDSGDLVAPPEHQPRLARAVLESTAFQTWEVLRAMEQDSGVSLETLRVDGGMTDDELLMQFQADIVDRVVVRPKVKETTALGAAFAAGLAVGVFDDLDDLRSRWGESRRWQPNMGDAARQKLLERWTKAVSRSVDWM